MTSASVIAQTIKKLRTQAEAGDAKAQYKLGLVYYHGREGLQQDEAKAVRWYRLAADQGHLKAQLALAYSYANGEGVGQDFREAVRWWQKVADQGHAESQFNLGNAYHIGRGIEQDYEEAVQWYRLAAEQGHADAQLNLGKMYYAGQSLPCDKLLAYVWFSVATAQGHKDAENFRDVLAKKMTQDKIAEGQKWSREFSAKINRKTK